MSAPWTADELAWADECVAAGDTAEDIAEMSGRTLADVRIHVRFRAPLTNQQRLALSLYTAGTTVRDIGREMKPNTPRPDALGAQILRRIRSKGYDLPARVPGRSPDQEAARYG